MTDLRETDHVLDTIEQLFTECIGLSGMVPEHEYRNEARRLLAAARPIIEREVIERLIAELDDDAIYFNGLPLGWSEWAGRLHVDDWLRSHLPE